MENRKLVKFVILNLFMAIAILPFFANAYSDKTTHPALTDEVVDLFNYYYPNLKLTNAEKEIVKQGSIDEDIPMRWMNHFYDPVYNRGIYGNLTSKQWSQDTLAQSNKSQGTLSALGYKYFSSEGDYSWDRAVFEYVHGDKNRALLALGHTLHLIEDATVPDHTRNDGHPPIADMGSPYEGWTSQFSAQNFHLADELIKNNKKPVIFDSLNKYFDELAIYSNNNFFSKDTIFDKEYLLPNIQSVKEERLSDGLMHTFGYNNKNAKLVEIDPEFNFETGVFTEKYKINDVDNLILSDYWNLLSSQAVLDGAGVVKLFFNEVEKEKQTLALLNKNKSFFDRVIGAVIGIFVKSNQSAAPGMVVAPEENNNNVEHRVFNMFNIGDGNASPGPSPALSPTPQAMQVSAPAPAPTPSPQPTPGVGSQQVAYNGPPYPGFGGGGGGAQTPSVSPSTLGVEELEPTPTPIPTPTPTPEETPTPSLEPTPIPSPEPSPEPSPSPEPTPTPTSLPESQHLDVIINEIAWTGTSKNTSSDEWIELYNNTDREINFGDAEWVLYSETDNTPSINLSGIIPARGFYLLERTNDSTIVDILADQIYTGDLNNGGEILALTHAPKQSELATGQASTTIDKTAMCGSGSYKWCPAGDYRYRSMERMDYDVAGTEQSNWWYNNELISNGIASNGNLVYGTPKARNSANYLITDANTSVVSSNITLKKSKSPYFLNNHNLNFQSGAVLTIEPGVVIKFWEAGLNFLDGAKIISQGTAEEPIVFTHFYDDEYGGDINNDATTSSPTPGSWLGISIGSTAGSGSVFSHSIIRYAGPSTNPIDKRASLVVEEVPVEIRDSVFEYSGICGLKVSESDSEISGNIFRNNNNGEDTRGIDSALWIKAGSPIVRSNTFIQNGRGIYLENALALIEENIFKSNNGEAIYSNGALGNFSGNSGSNNFINGIVVFGNITANEATTTLSANPLPYVIKRFNATVVPNSALIIPKDIIIKSDKSLNVEGNLLVEGENSADVVLTSLYDDSISGDTNNDGSATENNYGLWQGIVLKPGSYSEIKGATFRYANTALTYQNSPINLSNIKFEGNNLAIKADAGSVSLTIDAATIEFIDNIATTTPPLW